MNRHQGKARFERQLNVLALCGGPHGFMAASMMADKAVRLSWSRSLR
jgi:hypothetical protein